MIKPFLDKREAYEMRMLAYKKFKAPLPLEAPEKLFLLYMDRKTVDRGIKNQDEILEILSSYPGVGIDFNSFIVDRIPSSSKSANVIL